MAAPMDYSAAAQRGSARAAPPCREAVQQPLFHLPYLYGKSFFVDYRNVKPTATTSEQADFVLTCLNVPPLEVLSCYMDHVTQHLVVTVESEVVFENALAALRAGVA
jgi:hypothetical protein